MGHVYIYKPCKSAAQAGKNFSKSWVLRFDAASPLKKNLETGWISSKDMLEEVNLSFNSLEEAVRFSEKEGFSYTILKKTPQKSFPKQYGDNFRFDRKRF